MSVRPSIPLPACSLFSSSHPFIIHLASYLANTPPPSLRLSAIHLPHSLCLFLHTFLPPSSCLSMCFLLCAVGSIAKRLSALTFTCTPSPSPTPPKPFTTHTHTLERRRDALTSSLYIVKYKRTNKGGGKEHKREN